MPANSPSVLMTLSIALLFAAIFLFSGRAWITCNKAINAGSMMSIQIIGGT